ncbi:NAD(P)/FAD-dependent oxidoreductase [Bosea sp. 117]|uniref:FAD/NAD(P)-dependent oxidoreductase n=1 Tax=Bosea sp. 117 TaxID=1125973 RepID=UPI000493DA17|nr:NAD(P)/FAD-dependent oxidoreductase [Bosea sp. 117]
MNGRWDAVVIGTGPAGMAAAATLAEGGARTLVVDEQPEVGGQIYRAIERNRGNDALGRILGADYLRGAPLAGRLRASGAEIRLATLVWRIDEDRGVWMRRDGSVERAEARNVVIATGAMERPVPVPGWTLPGVMTIGALQILLKSSGLIPSGRLVLAGSGPLFYLFSRQCVEAGVSELTLLDTADGRHLPGALPLLPKALTGQGWRYLLKGAGLLAGLRRAGVTLYRGVSGITLEGSEHVAGIRFTHRGGTGSLACDTVGLHEGVIPHQQMTRSLGCVHDYEPAQQSFHPRRDAWGLSSRPGIFVAGDAGGIVGAQASAHEGTIAALAILHALGRLSQEERERRFAAEARARRAHLAARPFIDRLYTPRDEVLVPADATMICRCETVAARELRRLAGHGVPGPNQAKAFLRCGMGPCQGRLCGPTVTSIFARETGDTPDATGYYRIRSPLKPVTVGELAGSGKETGSHP